MDQLLAKSVAQQEIDAKKGNCVLTFNKTNGAFIAAAWNVDVETMGGTDYLQHVQVASFDSNVEEVVGYYPDFKIVSIEELGGSPILESDVDKGAAEKVTKEYPVAKQVNIISNALLEVARALNLPEKNEAGELTAIGKLGDMRTYIEEVLGDNERRKQFYRENPNIRYVSAEDEARTQAEVLEGGIHELLGARKIEGGTVFS